MNALSIRATLASVAALAVAAPALAQDNGELNLYSSRHYDTDERLYSDFEDQTGITINRIEGNADELIARLQAEGENSPADVFLTVDTSRLERAKDAGILQAVESDLLEERVPGQYQDSDNQWFGFSLRGRIIFYDKTDVENPPATYMDLASDDYEGQVCIRSSTNTYNQTLLASIIENEGAEAARTWAQGVVDNMARAPQGGDTDQLRGIVSGECDLAVSNTYYFARAIASDVDGVSGSLDQIGWVFPNQDSYGAHVNLSGGGIAANAPNRENAVAFLEYLASDSAQQYFAAGNNEYPVVEGVETTEAVDELGEFQADTVDLSAVAKQLPTAQEIFNEVGWE
ncbi:extracellular solute-binding protein [Roseivivax sp. GX 12232]|uniref:extracellular solute-binding protein n=1 Tax=Roseivivax sp. GX 12232 TaxID=2900547 RepID=UPI001E2E1616|nr:extracellular solute-binding protein [Roseivivax sp. GX 12232]MCE0504778.1 extracellular solute-binding protein [Roseivivax sp. GX 12232]